MSTSESDQQFPDYPLSVTALGFMDSSRDVKGSVRRLQILWEKDHENDLPTDLAFAKQLAIVGRNHIESIMDNYDGLEMAQYDNLEERHQETYGETMAAIVFGLAYEALDRFFGDPQSNDEGEYVFNPSYFFTNFDLFMAGTGLKSSDIVDVDEVYMTHYNQHRWNILINAAKMNGIASLFEEKQYLLPNIFGDFIQKLMGTPYVTITARRFGEVLALIESEEDRQKRTDRLNRSAPAPEPPTQEQMDVNQTARRLLGEELVTRKPDTVLDTPGVSSENVNANWNKRDDINHLLEDVTVVLEEE